MRSFREVTRNIKGPNKRKRLQAGKILDKRLKTTPTNSLSSSQHTDPKGIQGSEADLPRAVVSNFVFPVPEK
jgi:hypothetical protein